MKYGSLEIKICCKNPLFPKLHPSIIISSAYGDQTASDLRRERRLSLRHQRACIIPQPERFTEPLGALHALLD